METTLLLFTFNFRKKVNYCRPVRVTCCSQSPHYWSLHMTQDMIRTVPKQQWFKSIENLILCTINSDCDLNAPNVDWYSTILQYFKHSNTERNKRMRLLQGGVRCLSFPSALHRPVAVGFSVLYLCHLFFRCNDPTFVSPGSTLTPESNLHHRSVKTKTIQQSNSHPITSKQNTDQNTLSRIFEYNTLIIEEDWLLPIVHVEFWLRWRDFQFFPVRSRTLTIVCRFSKVPITIRLYSSTLHDRWKPRRNKGSGKCPRK